MAKEENRGANQVRICCYVENYIAGGADMFLVYLINHWPRDEDEFILICNRSHDGLEQIFKKRLCRRHRLIELDIITMPILRPRVWRWVYSTLARLGIWLVRSRMARSGLKRLNNRSLPAKFSAKGQRGLNPANNIWISRETRRAIRQSLISFGTRVLFSGVRGVLFLSNYLLYIYYVWKLTRLFRWVNMDALILNNGGYPGAESCRAAVIAGRLARTGPIVMVVHNLAVNIQQTKSRLGCILEHFIDRYVDRHSTLVVVSEAAKRALQQNRRISQQPRLIYNGVRECLPAEHNSVNPHLEFDLPVDCRIVGMVSSFDPRKGHETLLGAAPDILAAVPDARFLILGKGSPERTQRIRDLITHYDLEVTVTLCGFRTNVIEYMRLFDVLVFPSTQYEGCPMVLLEAMSCGVPVVAADIGGVAEIVEHGHTGFIVPPENPEALATALIKLLQTPTLVRKMKEASYRRYRDHFSVARMAWDYENLLRSLTIVSR